MDGEEYTKSTEEDCRGQKLSPTLEENENEFSTIFWGDDII